MPDCREHSNLCAYCRTQFYIQRKIIVVDKFEEKMSSCTASMGFCVHVINWKATYTIVQIILDTLSFTLPGLLCIDKLMNRCLLKSPIIMNIIIIIIFTANAQRRIHLSWHSKVVIINSNCFSSLKDLYFILQINLLCVGCVHQWRSGVSA